jgi:hypothetical protein
MELILQKMLTTTLNNLRLLQSKGHIDYKVMCEGEEYGNLVIAKKIKKDKKVRRKYDPLNLGHGVMRDYVVPYVKELQPGDIVSIPFNNYPPEAIRGNACSWCTLSWGKKTYTSSVNRKSNSVEIYRFPLNQLEEAPAEQPQKALLFATDEQKFQRLKREHRTSS